MSRFYAIVYPLKSRSVCTVSQARRVVGLAWILAALLALPRNWIQVAFFSGSGGTIIFYFRQIHLQIGNKVDGFYFWCIPNWEDEVKYRFSLICCNKTPQDDWKLFQLYMLIIVLILPSIIMTAAYSSISRKLLSLSTDTEQSLNR